MLYRTRIFTFLTILLSLAAACIGGCDEHLPPRVDPRDLLLARSDAMYVLTSTRNEVHLHLTLVNTYDETLDGTALVNGEISISLARLPAYARTFQLSQADIIWARSFVPSTQQLTIPPGDSVVFGVIFDFLDDQHRDMRTLFRYRLDPACGFRNIADREAFIISSNAQVFPRVASASAPRLLWELCHSDVWVNPRDCPSVLDATSNCL